jgi:hypothetical protein
MERRKCYILGITPLGIKKFGTTEKMCALWKGKNHSKKYPVGEQRPQIQEKFNRLDRTLCILSQKA